MDAPSAKDMEMLKALMLLANRDSPAIAGRWACRLAVEFDAGELGSSGRTFVAEKLFQRLFLYIGNMDARVGAWGLLKNKISH